MMMKLACLPAAAAAAAALALAVVVFLSDSASANMTTAKTTKPWVRGVNIGGWLVMERFITPYFFAITTCHLRGDFCFYPGQVDAPPLDSPDYQVCDLFHCKPVQFMSNTGELDYPIDMYTLLTAFHDKHIAKRWLEFHWEHFVTKDDIRTLHEAGVTHVRVPVPHWILEDSATIGDEPWVEGGWLYFIRLVSWCREFNIQVWPDIHTAPGSQNGFDNSGHALPNPTCTNWQNDPNNVNRTLKAVQDISQAIVDDGLSDVVTGFGTLNEPFVDCSDVIVRDYNERALAILRKNMGPATSVYVGDIFNSTRFADGWWTDEKYENTFLDSHYYHGRFIIIRQPQCDYYYFYNHNQYNVNFFSPAFLSPPLPQSLQNALVLYPLVSTLPTSAKRILEKPMLAVGMIQKTKLSHPKEFHAYLESGRHPLIH